MTTFENPDFQAHGERLEDVLNISLPLPEEIDSEWCEIFDAAYARDGVRATVYTDECLIQRLKPGCDPLSGPKYYHTEPLLMLTGQDFDHIDGLVAGAQMIPKFESEGIYEPYLALTAVHSPDGPLTESPDQRVLVSLEGLRHLSLYS